MNKFLVKEMGIRHGGIYPTLLKRGMLPKRQKTALENHLTDIRKTLENQLTAAIEGRITENVMDTVLNLMSVLFLLDKEYRKNIMNFEAVYVFTDQKNDFYVTVVFHRGVMKVHNRKVDKPTFMLRFRDNEALIKLLFSGAPDILNAMLNQEVDFQGNINYMNKFAYMALHLLLKVTGGQSFAEG